MNGVLFLEDRTQIKVPCDVNKVSDGYHSYEELYDHRQLLYIAFMKSHPEMSWRSFRHSDGSFHEGWFIAGMRTPFGDISYHIAEKYWYLLQGITTKNFAPPFDGHTSKDVLSRLEDWLADGVW